MVFIVKYRYLKVTQSQVTSIRALVNILVCNQKSFWAPFHLAEIFEISKKKYSLLPRLFEWLVWKFVNKMRLNINWRGHKTLEILRPPPKYTLIILYLKSHNFQTKSEVLQGTQGRLVSLNHTERVCKSPKITRLGAIKPELF